MSAVQLVEYLAEINLSSETIMYTRYIQNFEPCSALSFEIL